MLRNGVPGPGHFLGHLPRPQAPPDSGRIRGAQAPSLLLTFPDSQYPAPRDKRTVRQEGQTAGRRWPGGGHRPPPPTPCSLGALVSALVHRPSGPRGRLLWACLPCRHYQPVPVTPLPAQNPRASHRLSWKPLESLG